MLASLFYLVFPSFLIIDLLFLISTAFAQVFTKVFNPSAELVIPIGMPSNEAKVEIESHPLITEANII